MTPPVSKKTLTLDGSRIHDIASFYDEINRVFMADENWKLGHSLDGLDDLFYAGYGALKGAGPVALVWQDMAASRDALGLEETRRFHEAKRARPDIYNANAATRALEALDDGTGETFFDMVLSIIASHPDIELIAR